MFFYTGNENKLLQEVKPNLFLDDGWNVLHLAHTTLYYKGYVNDGDLRDQLVNIYYGQRPSGIWTVIHYLSDGSQVYTPNLRPYPLYKHHSGITNLGIHNLPIDKAIPYEGINYNPRLSLDDVATQSIDIIRHNMECWIKTLNEPPMLLFSGGVDSLALWAILDSITDDYKVHAPLPNYERLLRSQNKREAYQIFFDIQREYSSPLTEYLDKTHWGYELLHVMNTPRNYITGFWGDEIFLRNPDQLDLITKTRKQRIGKLVQPEHYMYYYLKKSTYDKSKTIDTVPDMDTALNLCQGWLYEDHQVWHINNDIHFSPYYDIRLFNLACQLSYDDIINHGLNGSIQTKMIEMIRPQFLQFLGEQKNNETNFSGWHKNFQNHPRLLQKLAPWNKIGDKLS